MEYGERHPQPYSQEYDWLGPDLTQNTREHYIPIFLVVLITTTRVVLMTSPNSVSRYPTLEQRLIQYVYDHTFIVRVWQSLHDHRYMNIIRLSYVDVYNNFKVKHNGTVRTPFLTHIVIKTLCAQTMWINANTHVRILSYNFFQVLIPRQTYMTGYSYVDIVRHIFRTNIFNLSIRFIWLIVTYIIPNLCCTTL